MARDGYAYRNAHARFLKAARRRNRCIHDGDLRRHRIRRLLAAREACALTRCRFRSPPEICRRREVIARRITATSRQCSPARVARLGWLYPRHIAIVRNANGTSAPGTVNNPDGVVSGRGSAKSSSSCMVGPGDVPCPLPDALRHGEMIHDWAQQRGWTQIPLVSGYGTTYQADYLCQGESDDMQWPVMHVFRKQGGKIRHFWAPSCRETTWTPCGPTGT